jgi:cystathionine gamma-synthase
MLPMSDYQDIDPIQSEKHGFVFIVDETVSAFGNVDVIAHSDFILTSLTKSFSGESNVMGGSIVLNPLSPHYNSLSSAFTSSHHNELFAADAAVLLANSQAFFPRTAKLNHNAYAMAQFLHTHKLTVPDSPIINVQHPAFVPSKSTYDAYLRPASAELPSPGYGCLLNVDFDSVENASAFYDRCGFYPSPHLAGHVTLMFPYNMFVFCKKAEERDYMRGLGVREESVRISAGLEDVEDLIDTLRDALDHVAELKRERAAAEEIQVKEMLGLSKP